MNRARLVTMGFYGNSSVPTTTNKKIMGKGKPKWSAKNKVPLEQQTVVTVTIEFSLFTVQDSGYSAEEFGDIIVRQIEKNLQYDETTWASVNEELAKQIK